MEVSQDIEQIADDEMLICPVHVIVHVVEDDEHGCLRDEGKEPSYAKSKRNDHE